MSAEPEHDPGVYDESCACDDCRAERGRRLSVLMFAPLLPYDLGRLYAARRGVAS